MNVLSLIIIALCLVNCEINDARFCTSIGKACKEGQTCCLYRYYPGWACYSMDNAVCCDDHITICPHNYICNDDDGTCDLINHLFFLTDDSSTSIGRIPKAIDTTIPFEYIEGLLLGLTFFDHLPSLDQCKPTQGMFDIGHRIYPAIKRVYDTKGKDGRVVSDLLQVLVGFVSESSKIADPCGALVTEFEKVLNKMKDHVSSVDFAYELPVHTVLNYKEIKDKYEKYIQEYENRSYNAAGICAGDLLKFFAFWDFQV